MSDNRAPENDTRFLGALQRAFPSEERDRWRFILLLLVVSILILLFIALLQQNAVLVQENQNLVGTRDVLGTKIITSVQECVLDCNDVKTTATAMQETMVAYVTASSNTPSPVVGPDTPTPPPPSNTALPTPTPTIAATFTSTPTSIPPTSIGTPSATSTPTSTSTPTPTDLPTPTTKSKPPQIPSPVVLAITPNTVQSKSGDREVTISGEHFEGGAKAWLGDIGWGFSIKDLDVITRETIIGTVSTDIPSGVYELTVKNPDGQKGVKSPAFRVYMPPGSHPDTTFESGAFIATVGPDDRDEGDDDHVQIIFFEIPETAPNDLYIRIGDADTGGITDSITGTTNTVMTYTVRGGAGAYTYSDARFAHPGDDGINSGDELYRQAIGEDPAFDGDNWLTVPITLTQGEGVGESRIFKLVVQGVQGDDANWYQVVVSAAANANVAVDGVRIFAYSWCLVPPEPPGTEDDAVPLYPYIPIGVSQVYQHNFDFDKKGRITLTTPLNKWVIEPESDGISGSRYTVAQMFGASVGETGATWTARYMLVDQPSNNAITVWFTRDDPEGEALPIFISPAIDHRYPKKLGRVGPALSRRNGPLDCFCL